MAASNIVKLDVGDYKTVIPVVASDTINISAAASNPNGFPYAKAIQVVVTGNIAIVDLNNVVHTVTGAPVGAIFQFPVKRVNLTGTTASVIGLI